MEDVVHPAIFSFQFPDTCVFTGLFLNFSGIQCVYYNNKPCVCKVFYPKFPKQPNRELLRKILVINGMQNFVILLFYKFIVHNF